MSTDTLGLSCRHGMLARSCEVCEQANEPLLCSCPPNPEGREDVLGCEYCSIRCQLEEWANYSAGTASDICIENVEWQDTHLGDFCGRTSDLIERLSKGVERLTLELEAAREGEEWFITHTQTAIALLGHVPRHESLSASCELWIAQARKRLVAIDAARKAEGSS